MEAVKKTALYFFYGIRGFFWIFFDLNEISVLAYHSISDRGGESVLSSSDFEKQMHFLHSQGYYFASLDEVVEHVRGERSLAARSVAITFDDGYADNYINALPILKKYDIPACVFMIVDQEKSGEALGYQGSFLNDEHIEEMKKQKISFGCHSRSHGDLSKMNVAELEDEMITGKRQLESARHCPVDYFAYPGGTYSDAAIAVAKKAYKAAFSIKPGLIHKADDVYMLKRNVVLRSMPLWQFVAQTTKAIEWYTKTARFFKKYGKNTVYGRNTHV